MEWKLEWNRTINSLENYRHQCVSKLCLSVFKNIKTEFE